MVHLEGGSSSRPTLYQVLTELFSVSLWLGWILLRISLATQDFMKTTQKRRARGWVKKKRKKERRRGKSSERKKEETTAVDREMGILFLQSRPNRKGEGGGGLRTCAKKSSHNSESPFDRSFTARSRPSTASACTNGAFGYPSVFLRSANGFNCSVRFSYVEPGLNWVILSLTDNFKLCNSFPFNPNFTAIFFSKRHLSLPRFT